MSGVEAVIFDCDGVLIDSEPLACGAEVATLTAAGWSVELVSFMSEYTGLSRASINKKLESDHGRVLPEGYAELVRARTAAAFEAALEAMPGIADLVDALEVKRCVASSSAPARLRQTLGLTGLWERFAPHVYSAAEVERGKPAPDLFLHAAAKIAVDPARAVVIEDSQFGVEGAIAAGMRAIGFVGGGHCGPGHAERLAAKGAFAVVSDMAGLRAELARMGALISR